MGTFKSKKTISSSPSYIPGIAREIERFYKNDGYEVVAQELIGGTYDISITKGGVFKAVLGMRTALKINIQPLNDSIFIEAGVGIFGQQALPTAISMLVFWPVLIPQIWGMIQQSQLDEQAINIAQAYVDSHPVESDNSTMKFCTTCGAQQESKAKFCNNCGAKL
ncbi:MAG: zinc ribbon domain-containing protein [Muribaculaceae bacterium]|nr:zinc ribbon domain-containing protein [Muribaculaceae bacterium]